MATINGSTNNSQWTFKLETTETATSIINKTSTVRVRVYLGRASSQSYLGGNYSLSVKCAEQTQNATGNIPYPTYINGGSWYLLKTFTFTVSNTGNPTKINISSTMTSSDFSPSNASASGTFELTKLHDTPLLESISFTETNEQLINVGIENDYFVTNLSIKKIEIKAFTFDDATITKYEILNGDKIYSSTSNIIEMNLKENDLKIIYDSQLERERPDLIIRFTDSLGGVSTAVYPYTYLIPYTKPSIEKASTTIKRKTGNGTVLTDNKVLLNFVGTCYKGNDVIGNNNKPIVQYKIWNTTEPTSYTTLTASNVANVTIKDYEISNILYTSSYNYKIKIYDTFTTTETTINVKTDKVPTGVSVWTEYPDRVDFIKITQQGEELARIEKITSEEFATNVFMGDKRVYKKIFTGTLPATTGSPVNLFTYDFDCSQVWIDESLSFFYTDAETLAINWFYTTTDYVRTVIRKSDKTIRYKSGGNLSSFNYNIVLAYTKD